MPAQMPAPTSAATAPTASVDTADTADTADSTGADLPLRDSTEIQGDILAGFRKDHARLLLLRFDDPAGARDWLRELRGRIATTREVTAFNASFRMARRSLSGRDPDHLAAVWRGIGFTHDGLVALVVGSPIADVPRGTTQEAFVQGPAARCELVGDVDDNAPEHWLFGAPHTDAVHAVLTVAADRTDELRAALAMERKALAHHRVTLVFDQECSTLPDQLAGAEHFGFRDGISQPGVVGYDEPDPARPDEQFGKPGTRLIPAGEFVVGHPLDHRLPAWLPPWMVDGSFQVVRRLAQDVPGWWRQAAEQLKVLREQGAAPQDATEDWVAARLVGRWRSGAHIATHPDADPGQTPPPSESNDVGYADDQDGRITPLFCHLRKTNPRDGLRLTQDGQGTVALKGGLDGRRIIRRSIPFGPHLDLSDVAPDAAGTAQDTPRGLVFVCYQSDLVAQFEFMQGVWVDGDDFPQRDPMVGRDGMVGRGSTVAFPAESLAADASVPLSLKQFVRTEGALYLFAPSLSALAELAEGSIPVGGGPAEDRVLPGPTLVRPGEVVSSGKARLRFEDDGDLRVRDEHEEVRWEAGAAGGGAVRAEFRETGELVLPAADGEVVWATPTAGHPDATLVVGADGDVSIRAADGTRLWHTDTAH